MEARGIHRRTPIVVDASLINRLNDGLGDPTESGCIEWTKATRDGYGAIKNRGKVLGTHVVAFTIHNGPIQDGLIVGHSCDNRSCCNPEHLQAMTAHRNALDTKERNRLRPLRGEDHPNASLTNDQAALIKSLYVPGEFAAKKIARLLNISASTVENVIHRKRYANVEAAT